MGTEITVDELRIMLSDSELMKDLPISKEMIDFIVELVRNKAEMESLT